MKKVEILGHYSFVVGEKAEEALDYILKEEDRMNHQAAGAFHFSSDYTENVLRFYREAIKKFNVRIFDSFSDREYYPT